MTPLWWGVGDHLTGVSLTGQLVRFAGVRKRKSGEEREGGRKGGREEDGREGREGRERDKGREGKRGMKLFSVLYQSTKADKTSTFGLTLVMPENQEQRDSVLVTLRLAQASLWVHLSQQYSPDYH